MTYAEHVYRGLQAEVEAAKLNATYWRNKFDALNQNVATLIGSMVNPPIQPNILADAESFNAGKAMAFNEAKYTIGIDTSDGMHTVTVFRTQPGQPTTLVASARLPERGAA